MKKFVIISLAIIGVVVVGAVWKISAFQPQLSQRLDLSVEAPDFSALVEASAAKSVSLVFNGQVIASKLGDEVRPTASTAKMILALAVVKAKPFSPDSDGATITYNERDLANYNYQVANGGSRTLVAIGASISERQALEALLIASSNNLADSLAAWAFGSIDAYRSYAYNMLLEHDIHGVTIGRDASGFSPSTTASVNNLAKIGSLVLADPILSEIVKQPTAVIPLHGPITNTNGLLRRDSAIIGIKTGTTAEAGSCFILGAKDDLDTIVVAILNAGASGATNEAYDLYKKALAVAKNQLVVKKGAVVGVITAGWLAEPITVYAGDDLSADIWDVSSVHLDLKLSDNLLGQSGEVGQLELQSNTEQTSIPVYINQKIPPPGLIYKLLN